MIRFISVGNEVYVLKTPFGQVTSAVTLVNGKEGAVLIDSGANDATVDECIVPALQDLGVRKGDIHYLLCTHTHGDHIGGHFRLKEIYPQAQIVATEEQAPKLADPLRFNIAIRSRYPRYSSPPSSGLRGVTPDLVLKGGERAGGLVCVPAPGHDTDSVCWLEEKSGTLVSGDSLQGGGTDTQGIALYFDLEMYRKTLKDLRGLGAAKIVAGHDFNVVGGLAQGKEESAAFIEKCRRVTEEYDAFLRTLKTRDPAVAARELIQKTGGKEPKYLFLAMYTVDAHFRCMHR